MALFDFDFDFAARRAEREKAERTRAAMARFTAAQRAGAAVPVAPPPFAGVSAEGTDADLALATQNQDMARRAAAAQAAFEDELTGSMLDLQAAGLDAKPAIESAETLRRSRAIEEMRTRGDLDPYAYVDALNKKPVSPFELNSAGIINRYTGEYGSTPAVDALTGQRLAGAGKYDADAAAADALARYRHARAGDEEFRSQAVQDILSEPTHPLVAADVLAGNTVYKPETVKVRRRDGTEALMMRVPQQDGTFSYSPAIAGGQPLISEPGPGDGTNLQKDTAFIAQTLGIAPNEALLWKMTSARKAPEEAWAELVGRLATADKWAKPDKIEQKARDVWALARPGQPVPSAAAPGSSAVGAGTSGTSAAEQDAVRRAEADGYSEFGSWVPGRGLEIFDGGKLVGYYQ